MNACQGRTSQCSGGPTYPVRIAGVERHVCERCHEVLRGMGMSLQPVDPEWVRRAKASRLPAKEYAA